VNGRLEPATFDAVPSTPPPEDLAFGFAIVAWAPSTPPTGAALALCVELEVLLEVLLDVLELVFDDVLELEIVVVAFDTFELVLDDVMTG
jgi:hypothetical protein